MMVYGRLVHVFPFLAVALLEACGGAGDAALTPPRTASPGIAVGEPHPQAPVARDFTVLSATPVSGVTKAQNVVVRTEAEFRLLWNEHTSNRLPAPALPKVDFGKQMVVGLFVGQLPHGCGTVALHHASNAGAKVTVSYEASTAHGEVCAAVMGSAAVLAAVERSEAPVEFVTNTSAPVALQTLAKDGNSGVREAKTAVVRDETAWAALWAEHDKQSRAPAVDFTRHMVVASFLGEQSAACNDLTLLDARRAGKVVTVQRVVMEPGDDVMCIQAMTSPMHMILLEKSDDQVVVATRPASPL